MIWVRSQDGTILAEMSNFRICEYFKNKRIIGYVIDAEIKEATLELGFYSTKEKALKVLDMMQEARTPRVMFNVDGRIEQLTGEETFIMPQDDEVEDE